jgi:hypothetical protein
LQKRNRAPDILRETRSDYLVLAAMLVALALFFVAHQAIWGWLTEDLRDGAWICALTDTAIFAEAAKVDAHFRGLEGRFVWAASALLLIAVIAAIVAGSAYSVLATITRWRGGVAVVGALILLTIPLAGALTATPDHQSYMNLSSSPGGCGFANVGEGPFQFSRYLLLIFQPYYETGARVPLLDVFSLFEQLLPALVWVCNLFVLAALLVVAWPDRDASLETPGLARRIACFRLLLVLGSALFTAISLYYLSQYAWFAQALAAGGPEGAEQLRGLQRGVTLFLATSNSLAIVLLFAPPGWILSRRAIALSRREALDISGQTRSEWLTQKELNIFSGPVMRAALAAAPLLVSSGVMLLERALMGS